METAPRTKRSHRRRRHGLMFLLVALTAAACASDAETATESSEAPTSEPAADPEPTATTEPTPAPEPTATLEATPTPDPTPTAEASTEPVGDTDSTPASEAFDWMVGFMNAADPDIAEVESRFAPEFLAVVSAQQVMDSLVPDTTWMVLSQDFDQYQGIARITADDQLDLDVELSVQSEEPYLINGLLLRPAAADIDDVTTVAEFEQVLSDTAPLYRYAVFDVVDDKCSAVIDLGADEPLPTGSVFKLWVLVELAHQIESGEAAWEETMPITDAYKSSPGGAIFDREEGTDITLRTLAEEMIVVSDNSATDHLMYRLGRERVEAAMTPSGVAEPARNIPMMTTSDLFRIKFDPTPPNSDDYRNAGTDARREMLDAMQEEAWVASLDDLPLTNVDGVSINEPRDHDIEWFATPRDLCRTHIYLAELAERPGLEPVADILREGGINLEVDEAVWSDVRFKGGSEQGLLSGAIRAERADGRVFVLAGNLEDPENPLNPAQAGAALEQGLILAAQLD